MQTIGTRAQVWHGNAKKTSGGLTKSHLMMNKHGRIVSRKKHASGKKTIKHLKSLGYVAKKGEFKLFHKGHKSRKMRGGTGAPMGTGSQLDFPLQQALSHGGRRSHKMRGGMGPMGNSGMNNSGMNNSGMNNSGTMEKAMIADKMMNSGSGSGSQSGPMMNSGNNGGNRMRGGRRRMRGGMALGGELSPHPFDGQGVGTSGVNLQFVAGNAG